MIVHSGEEKSICVMWSIFPFVSSAHDVKMAATLGVCNKDEQRLCLSLLRPEGVDRDV